MTLLALGAILVVALLVGFVTGWTIGKGLGLAMPNVLATTLMLTAGSLGGPLFTYALLGRGTLSYALALLAAGCTVGITFWPMGETQGRESAHRGERALSTRGPDSSASAARWIAELLQARGVITGASPGARSAPNLGHYGVSLLSYRGHRADN